MKRLALVSLLSIFILSGHAFAATTTGVWNINDWNPVTMHQDGATITGEYAGAGGGNFAGTLEGNIFKGWFNPNVPTNNAKCGPDNAWGGVIKFEFSADGKSATGDQGSCWYDHDHLVPSWFRGGALVSGSPISFNAVSTGDCKATFDPQTGRLLVPCVEIIGYTGSLWVEFFYSGGVVFSLTSYGENQ
ncbi:MAG: hypothetical protein HZA17_13355 [Nitrospirae bacterium]|nr:hypothetical protein [Nitrospirota bacterium]